MADEDEIAQFNGKIGPRNLLGLVRNTAPFLFEPDFERGVARPAPSSMRLIEMGGQPYGWLDILKHGETLAASEKPSTEQREDYFALCIACHHATVATYIPTDVDAKIRGQLWQQREDPAALRRMFELTLQWLSWDLSRISRRATALSGVGPVSGHNGEMLSVLAGALGGFVKRGDLEYAARAAAAIDAELQREVQEFRAVRAMKGREVELLKLAASLTHNVGDIDQSISFWAEKSAYEPYRVRFHHLAHENSTPYGGTFQVAARLYKKIMAPEGHRNYPLRNVRKLRTSPDFLLPLGPFFDEWGECIGRHPALSLEDRAETLAALLSGCKKIPGQVGYFRAISGFARALEGRLEAVNKRLPAALRHELASPEVRKHMALQQVSFESGMRKRAIAEL